MFRNVNELMSEVHKFSPVLIVIGKVTYFHFVDQGVLHLVLDHRLSFICLIGANEICCNGRVDHTQTRINGSRIICGTILS